MPVQSRKGISSYMSLMIFMTLAILFAVLLFGSISGWWDQAIQQFTGTVAEHTTSATGS